MTEQKRERRRHLRIKALSRIRVISKGSIIHQTVAKDISPLGVRLEVPAGDMKVNDTIELKIEMPKLLAPVHAKAKIVWKRDIPEKAGGLCDIGCEFTKIEEDNKNTFLKFFCALLQEEEEKLKHSSYYG
ncbi:MAG: PilZ domain-containing protein [Candidatus Omnitrophica bacterium]|nr:PilZ domain-containing protein [Candidatus Omnitrophota bacterium]